MRTALLDKAPEDFKTLINHVRAKITTVEITGLNRQVGLDKQDPKTVAGAWLKQRGLVK
jgi:glycine betaine/choline ABC-type transport system substrate-binding protein